MVMVVAHRKIKGKIAYICKKPIVSSLQLNMFRSALGRSGRRWLSTAMDSYEQKIFDKLLAQFEPTKLEVKDVSGGCGSMFAILVESSKFKGIPMIKQHRLVNEALKEDIAQWHGLQLRTKAPKP